MTRKYEITDIAHPKYPWLHRIRALRNVREDVHAGDLGGYVQCEDNFSQESSCWIYDDAISCEEGIVSKEAVLKRNACVRGNGFASSEAVIDGSATVEDFGIVMAGTVSGHAHISGNSIVRKNNQSNQAPRIEGDAYVYGSVAGNVLLTGFSVLLPGTVLDNPSPDRICIDGREVIVMSLDSRAHCVLPPPKGFQQPTKKKHRHEPER